MKESNKLVVKVKYQGSTQDSKIHSGLGMVTEWHIGRIVVAAVIILLFVGGVLYLLNGGASQSVDTKLITKILPEINKEPTETIVKIPKEITQNKQLQAPVKPSIKSINKQILTTKAKDISNQNIARALLVTEVNNKEPGGEILLPLVVNKEQASGVFYFTEITNMKGNVLFHQWHREGKLVYERKIKILGNRWRVSTSKLISYSKVGMWTVRLVNKQGVVFNKIEFEVIK